MKDQFKTKNVLLYRSVLIAVLILINCISGVAIFSQSKSITSFYYYKNSKNFLELKYDYVYVRLINEMSKEQFINSTQSYNQLFDYKNFISDEKNQMIKLNSALSENAITELLHNLKSSVLYECVSPVYSLPGRNNTLSLISALNEIIVQYKPTVSNKNISDIEQVMNLTFLKTLSLTGGKTIVYKVDENTFSIDAANEMFESGIVNYSEPNFYTTNLMQYIPNDPYFSWQWSLRNTGNNVPIIVNGIAGCDMRVDSAWNITLGSNKVKIAIVDTGIDTLHEDLIGNLVPNSQYNFVNESTNAFDDEGHGTACAGIVAATGNNAIGVTGAAPNCKIVNIKSLGTNGGTNVDLAEGLIYSWQSGCWVSSNSWGGGSPSSLLDNAILDGITYGRNGKGTVYLFAAGNYETNLINPSTNPNVISVGAVSPCNQRKSLISCDAETFWGSCYGTGLEIVSPGVKIYTTDITGPAGYSIDKYIAFFNGTSSATPNAAGIAALMLSVDSTLTWDKVREYLCRSADRSGNYNYTSAGPDNALGNTWNNEMGYGKVNAYKALRYTEGSKGFSFIHNNLQNTENLSGPYVVNSSIVSVNGSIDPAGTKVFWERGNVRDSVTMTNNGGNNWTANISGNGMAGSYKYHIKATDVTGVSKTYPVLAPETYFSFNVLNDISSPVISHTVTSVYPIQFWPAKIKSIVTDSIGIDSVWVNWNRNSSALTKHFKLTHTEQNNFEAWFNSISSDVSNGDSIFYKLFAQDNSVMHNRDSTSQYKIKISFLNLCQDYSATTFPPEFWLLEYSNLSFWSRATVSAFSTGSGSATFRFYDAEPGVTQSMLTNPFEISQAGDSLRFNHAYATYQTEIDSLIIEVSSNSGVSYSILARLRGGVSGNLVTAPPTANNFIPLSSQWATKKYALPVGTNLIRFRTVSGYGNNLYLDNICKINGTTGISNNLNEEIPNEYSLSQNYPNPFNPITKIKYSVPVNGLVSLKVYDILGKEIITIINDNRLAGNYETEFNGVNLSSGIYFLRMEAGEFKDVKRMILVK